MPLVSMLLGVRSRPPSLPWSRSRIAVERRKRRTSVHGQIRIVGSRRLGLIARKPDLPQFRPPVEPLFSGPIVLSVGGSITMESVGGNNVCLSMRTVAGASPGLSNTELN